MGLKEWREEEIRKIAREEAEKVFEENTKKPRKGGRSIYEGMPLEQMKERMTLGKTDGE